MRTHIYIVLAALLAFPLLTRAEEVVVSDTIGGSSDVEISSSRDIEVVDSLSDVSSNVEDSVPEWYVAPEIPEALRSPMRATTSGCLTDSILTFNADSVLTETTIYEYDAANRAIRTIVWKYDASGILSTSSKQEYAYDAAGTQIYTGTFAWDTNTNDWRGTAKSEFVYNEAHKMESNITYTWVNNTWLPLQALTYVYDAAGREAEFTTYTRNASVNHLMPSNQRIQTWYNASKKTLEVNYTAYSNGAWSAGTKKVWEYDSKGNQTLYDYFSAYSNGEWTPSTHDTAVFNASNKKTYAEKRTYKNGAWTNTQKEIWDFDAAGNNTIYEKYTGSGSSWNGSKKEEYGWNASKKKIFTITYTWKNSNWMYSQKTETPYDQYNNQTETTKYYWANDSWVGNGKRTVKVFNASKKVIEQTTYTWGDNSWVGNTKLEYAYSGSNTTMEADYTWSDQGWVGGSKVERFYNAVGLNDSTRTYVWGTNDWVFDFRTKNTYDAQGNLILGHSASWDGTRWVMTGMTRTDLVYDSSGRLTLSATWQCGSDSIWVGDEKSTVVFDSHGNTTLATDYFWSTANNDWQIISQNRYDIDYDEADHVTSSASYTLNTSTMTWRGLDKSEYGYDASENLIYQSHYNWSGSNWVQDGLMQAVYNAQNKPTLETYYTLISGVWTGVYKTENEYEQNGWLSMAARYNWNSTRKDWEGSTKYEYAYSDSMKVMDVAYTWSQSLWNWIGSSKYEYVFDSQKREIVRTYKVFDESTLDWMNSTKTERGFNIRGLNNMTATYEWLNNAWSPTSLTNSIYDDADNKIRREMTGTWTAGVVGAYTDKHYFYSCDAPASNGSQPRTPTEIEEIDENNGTYENNVQPFDPTQPTYNLSGQRIDPASYHGLVIQSGHTYLLP